MNGEHCIEMKRRTFVHYLGTLGTVGVLMPELLSCQDNKSSEAISIKILGANHQRGHQLRDGLLKKGNKKSFKIKNLIIGGGISGLSTAYHLKEKGCEDFILLEMGEKVGGNSGSESNEYTNFPLGAHYLTLPNPENRPLIDFLIKHRLIVAETIDGKQEYNERHLCFAPDERLLFRGVFQEGLVPTYGIEESEKSEMKRFFELMDEWQQKKGSDGKYLFSIPLEFASSDKEIEELDAITFDQFLEREGFHSEELRWFLDYCSRDDFGAGSNLVSAWAGINYFAGRRSNPSNTIPSNVLTWPEGNGFLVNLLKKNISTKIQTDVLIYSVEEFTDKVLVKAYDFKEELELEIEAEKLVLSTPSYVNKHLLKSPQWPSDFFDGFIHHPWLVCAVVLNKIPKSVGQALSWDNVCYGTKGLGYIYDQHQHLRLNEEKVVVSVYLALDKNGHKDERKRLFEMSQEELKELVLIELNQMHAEIQKEIVSMTFQLWGHGMVSSYPGSLKKQREFEKKLDNSERIYLAHTDFAGYSVFEEGFQRGINAASFILNQHNEN